MAESFLESDDMTQSQDVVALDDKGQLVYLTFLSPALPADPGLIDVGADESLLDMVDGQTLFDLAQDPSIVNLIDNQELVDIKGQLIYSVNDEQYKLINNVNDEQYKLINNVNDEQYKLILGDPGILSLGEDLKVVDIPTDTRVNALEEDKETLLLTVNPGEGYLAENAHPIHTSVVKNEFGEEEGADIVDMAEYHDIFDMADEDDIIDMYDDEEIIPPVDMSEIQINSPAGQEEEQDLFYCFVCNEPCLSAALLSSHMVSHTKQLKCTHCKKVCRGQHALENHERTHSIAKPLLCCFCANTFSGHRGLQMHIARAHPEQMSGPDSNRCPDCGKLCASKGHLVQHKAVHKKAKPLPFVCPYCRKQFDTKAYLVQHIRIHDVSQHFLCCYCPQKFSQQGSLRRHTVKFHPDQLDDVMDAERHRCPVCDKQFGSKGHLERHFKIHTGEKTHKCEFCEKSYVEKRSMEKHLKNHHSIMNFSYLEGFAI